MNLEHSMAYDLRVCLNLQTELEMHQEPRILIGHFYFRFCRVLTTNSEYYLVLHWFCGTTQRSLVLLFRMYLQMYLFFLSRNWKTSFFVYLSALLYLVCLLNQWTFFVQRFRHYLNC